MSFDSFWPKVINLKKTKLQNQFKLTTSTLKSNLSIEPVTSKVCEKVKVDGKDNGFLFNKRNLTEQQNLKNTYFSSNFNICNIILCLNVKGRLEDRLRVNSPLVKDIYKLRPIAFFAIETMQSKPSKNCLEI